VHPAGRYAARGAGRLAFTRPGLDAHRLPGQEYTLDRQAGQVREQDAENLKIARPA